MWSRLNLLSLSLTLITWDLSAAQECGEYICGHLASCVAGVNICNCDFSTETYLWELIKEDNLRYCMRVCYDDDTVECEDNTTCTSVAGNMIYRCDCMRGFTRSPSGQCLADLSTTMEMLSTSSAQPVTTPTIELPTSLLTATSLRTPTTVQPAPNVSPTTLTANQPTTTVMLPTSTNIQPSPTTGGPTPTTSLSAHTIVPPTTTSVLQPSTLANQSIPTSGQQSTTTIQPALATSPATTTSQATTTTPATTTSQPTTTSQSTAISHTVNTTNQPVPTVTSTTNPVVSSPSPENNISTGTSSGSTPSQSDSPTSSPPSDTSPSSPSLDNTSATAQSSSSTSRFSVSTRAPHTNSTSSGASSSPVSSVTLPVKPPTTIAKITTTSTSRPTTSSATRPTSVSTISAQLATTTTKTITASTSRPTTSLANKLRTSATSNIGGNGSHASLADGSCVAKNEAVDNFFFAGLSDVGKVAKDSTREEESVSYTHPNVAQFQQKGEKKTAVDPQTPVDEVEELYSNRQVIENKRRARESRDALRGPDRVNRDHGNVSAGNQPVDKRKMIPADKNYHPRQLSPEKDGGHKNHPRQMPPDIARDRADKNYRSRQLSSDIQSGNTHHPRPFP